jgi:hypothetical protein
VQHFPDGSRLLLMVNLGDRPRTWDVDLAALGIEGAARAYDVLRDDNLGVFSGKLETEPVEPRGSLMLRLTEARRVPAVVGSTLHLSGGAIETVRLREADGAVRLRLRLPGTRDGRVLLGGPEAPMSVHVSFDDDVEVEVAAPRVEDRGEISDE